MTNDCHQTNKCLAIMNFCIFRMKLPISLVLIHCLIHFHQNVIIMAKPMYGPNVRNATRGEFPFVVSLSLVPIQGSQPGTDHVCTGVLVTRQDVLTAAHCFANLETFEAVILVGSNNLREAISYGIHWWISYRNWITLMELTTQFVTNDIGNIRLNEMVPQNLNLAPISPLPVAASYNMNVVIAGWGFDERDVVPLKMRTTELQVHHIDDARNLLTDAYGRVFEIHDRHIYSSGNPYLILGQGDSGAPVLLNGMLIGIQKSIISFTNPLHRMRRVNIHTSISYYIDFIRSVIDPNSTDFD